MKIRNHIYLKGFTLVELVITLIISGIVIAFTMSAFMIVSKLHHNYSQKTEKLIYFQKLNYLLQKDNLESFQILEKNNGFMFDKDSFDVEYSYSESFLVRTQNNKRDSFELTGLKIKQTFKNEPIFSEEIVDLLQIVFNEDKTIIISKEYAAKELMHYKK